ncbi:MAG: AtpZ/AtpI family protein [Lachnospiraceae bacterium]|nr:AtpZ/AtpI family protein [Lachnospiraceae bacterium]
MHMLVPIFLCSFLGYWLDQKMETGFLFILFFFLGALAGGRNVFLLARRVYDSDSTRPSESYAANLKKKNKEKERKHKSEV